MSKKTPKSVKAKIKSGHKLLVALSLIPLIVIVAWFNLRPDDVERKSSVACIQIEQNCFELEVADTDRSRTQGLSDREALTANKGMLFVFDEVGRRCFWMKDMRFNLDIIWTDQQKEIIKIEENVPPDTYPGSFCSDNTQYVLEFSQGFAAKYGLKVGTTLQFEHE